TRNKCPRRPGRLPSPALVYALAAKDLKRVKGIPEEKTSRFPQNVNTAAPQTQRVTGVKTTA
ncbi:hypothetical protein, partial [Pantoea sp. GbtcB22]|uniref:hypothetical protein n=1 Tax=Pantoea sp. GbtcB22 TaxID=2824767 RepID=UPI001C30B290